MTDQQNFFVLRRNTSGFYHTSEVGSERLRAIPKFEEGLVLTRNFLEAESFELGIELVMEVLSIWFDFFQHGRSRLQNLFVPTCLWQARVGPQFTSIFNLCRVNLEFKLRGHFLTVIHQFTSQQKMRVLVGSMFFGQKSDKQGEVFLLGMEVQCMTRGFYRSSQGTDKHNVVQRFVLQLVTTLLGCLDSSLCQHRVTELSLEAELLIKFLSVFLAHCLRIRFAMI